MQTESKLSASILCLLCLNLHMHYRHVAIGIQENVAIGICLLDFGV